MLWLPWPPSVNDLYRPGEKRGSRHLTAPQLAFRSTVATILHASRIPTHIGPLSYHVDLYPAAGFRGDGDNHAFKAIWDALQAGGAIGDDRQFKQFSGTVHSAVAVEARAHILVKALQNAG